MRKVLIPVDGSENSNRAIEHVIKLNRDGGALDLHLLYIDPALSGDISMFIDKDVIAQHHREQGEKALKSARALLDRAGCRYAAHIAVGDIAETAADYVREKNIDEIIMGTRGMSSVGNLLLGSVATKVIHLVSVPVTLVK